MKTSKSTENFRKHLAPPGTVVGRYARVARKLILTPRTRPVRTFFSKRSRSVEKLYEDAMRRVGRSQRVEAEKAKAEAASIEEARSKVGHSLSGRLSSASVRGSFFSLDDHRPQIELKPVDADIQRVIARHGFDEVLSALGGFVSKRPDIVTPVKKKSTTRACPSSTPGGHRTSVSGAGSCGYSSNSKARSPISESDMKSREKQLREKLLGFAKKFCGIELESPKETEEDSGNLQTIVKASETVRSRGLQRYLKAGGWHLRNRHIVMSKPGQCKGD